MMLEEAESFASKLPASETLVMIDVEERRRLLLVCLVVLLVLVEVVEATLLLLFLRRCVFRRAAAEAEEDVDVNLVGGTAPPMPGFLLSSSFCFFQEATFVRRAWETLSRAMTVVISCHIPSLYLRNRPPDPVMHPTISFVNDIFSCFEPARSYLVAYISRTTWNLLFPVWAAQIRL